MQNFNNLTPAESERLALILEELGEAQQSIGKILRHGQFEYSPFDASQITNQMNLEKEIGHVYTAVYMMAEAHDISIFKIQESQARKLESVKMWLHHN